MAFLKWFLRSSINPWPRNLELCMILLAPLIRTIDSPLKDLWSVYAIFGLHQDMVHGPNVMGHLLLQVVNV